MPTSLLLADDSPTIAKILGMALASEDYQIRSVLTADEAIRELKANPPFFFLVDLTLPGKNGLELTQMIRGDSKLSKVKVVLLSSAFEPVDEAAVKASGADLVIAKPFDPAELRASLRAVKDAPPKFASGAKVSGSLSGQTVAAAEGTLTSLTDPNLVSARATIAKKQALPPEELLLGNQNDLDANSILAALAENGDGGVSLSAAASLTTADLNVLDLGDGAQDLSAEYDNATAMLDLSGDLAKEHIPENVLDLAPSLHTPAGGTAVVDLSSLDHREELALKSDAPPLAPPPSLDTPPPPPKTTPARNPTPASPAHFPELSPNAQALAAFFSAEIESQSPSPQPSGVSEAEEFEKSMPSIEWDDSADKDLASWSATAQGPAQMAPPIPPPAKAAQAPLPASPQPIRQNPSASGAGGAGSFLFDTGDSNFRFAEDYITRITKSFVGHPHEEAPKDFDLPVFHQQSSDAHPSTTGNPGNWNPTDAQKMEQIVREEVQMAVREVVEKVAWEVIPELAENLIKKELEKVMKQLEGQN